MQYEIKFDPDIEPDRYRYLCKLIRLVMEFSPGQSLLVEVVGDKSCDLTVDDPGFDVRHLVDGINELTGGMIRSFTTFYCGTVYDEMQKLTTP